MQKPYKYRTQVHAHVIVRLEDGSTAKASIVVPAHYDDENDILIMATEGLVYEELEIGKVVGVESLRYATQAG